MKQKVQLVLGCGGARGLAHIGVIEKLLDGGFEIIEVVGSSMGAVVGGVYCAGYLPQYTDFMRKQSRRDIYRLFDFALSRQGFLKGEKVFNVLQQIAGEQLIENLPIPFTAVAADIVTRTEFHFSKGNLYKALRASTGLPGVLTPVAENKNLFVDGGVLNPLPVNLIKRRDDAIVVAVNLNGTMTNEPTGVAEAASANSTGSPGENTATMSRLRKYFSSFAPSSGEMPSLSMFEIYTAAFDAAIDRLTEISIQQNPPDILVEIPRNAASTFEFHRTAELIEAGKKAYNQVMGQRAV